MYYILSKALLSSCKKNEDLKQNMFNKVAQKEIEQLSIQSIGNYFTLGLTLPRTAKWFAPTFFLSTHVFSPKTISTCQDRGIK